MRICIVGGTGNISRAVVDLLVHHGHDVTVFNRGNRDKTLEIVKTMIGDRKERKDFESRIKEEKFDAAIDFLCFDREDALSDIRAFSKVDHFIHVSTTCTYGVDYDYLPVDEEHPLRPITNYGRKKVEADEVFEGAFHNDGFPVTIIKPSTTFGPQMGLLRQIAWDFSWLHRIETGRPVLILGEGNAPHQFLHVNDAALCFAHTLGRSKCVGQTYNMMNSGFVTWKTWHETAMRIIGQEVELIGTTLAQLEAYDVPNHGVCKEIFAHNCYYSSEKLMRDVPEFKPKLSLEQGMRDVYEKMKIAGTIPESPLGGWEDRMIEKISRI